VIGLKIAVITSSYPRYPGDGVAPFVKSICENLAKLGHAVEVVAPYDPAIAPMEIGNVSIHRFRYVWPKRFHIMGHARSLDNDTRLRPLTYILLPLFLLAAFFSLMRACGRQKSEIIYAHWVIPNGLVAACVAALRGLPFILSLHGSDIYVARRNRIFAAVARWVFRRASGVTACSPELRQTAIELGASQKTMLLPWGADPQIFHPGHRNDQDFQTFQVSQSEIILVALGRFVQKKGFANLLSAMPGVLNGCPQARLMLGGDGALKDELASLAKQLGISERVSFTGQIPWNQVPTFLARADIFVLPSVRDRRGNVDGLPTVLLEAMSSGLAVVASDIGGVSLVIKNGYNGLLIPPGDIEALAKAILDLACNEERRQAIGQAARQSVIESFNWQQVARQITALLETAIQQYQHA
jgi:glycosyltransferase involved in cell wall biosynthesis